MKKPKKAVTVAEKQIERFGPLLTQGSLVALDPSSASRQSLPGFSVWKAGVLVDSGLIDVHHALALNSKLFGIANTLRTEFEEPDLVVTELISSYMGGFSKSIMNLQRSVGVIMSIWDRPLVEVSPVTWHKRTPEGYQKGDEADAIMIGWTAVQIAFERIGEKAPPLPDWGMATLLGQSVERKNHRTGGKLG